MSRSIELLDRYATESANVFGLNRRGYLYLTAERTRLDAMARQAGIASAAGAGLVSGSSRPGRRDDG